MVCTPRERTCTPRERSGGRPFSCWPASGSSPGSRGRCWETGCSSSGSSRSPEPALSRPRRCARRLACRPGTPLIRVDTAQVAARVETIRQVASARVSKDWPDGLSITVTERVPVVAVRMAGGGYDLVDHDGVIVTYQRAKPTALPLFQTALHGQMHGNPDVATASAVLAELPPWLHREVAKVAVTSTNSSVGGAASGSGDAENATVPASGSPVHRQGPDRRVGQPGHGRNEGKRACYPHARSGELLRCKRPEDRRHQVTERFRAGACSRHIEEVRAWLVDPGAQPPYCPYQS